MSDDVCTVYIHKLLIIFGLGQEHEGKEKIYTKRSFVSFLHSGTRLKIKYVHITDFQLF